jgi:hypothetical protein
METSHKLKTTYQTTWYHNLESESSVLWEPKSPTADQTFCNVNIFHSCGPIFGAGADFLIASNCNTNMDSYSNLPHPYDGDNASCSILMRDYNFSVIDYEVFTPVGGK